MMKGELIETRCKEFYSYLKERVGEGKQETLKKFHKEFFGAGTGGEVLNRIVGSGLRKADLVQLISNQLGLPPSDITPWMDLFYRILEA